MIVVDASALLAILLGEPEAETFSTILATAGGALMSPVNLWETLVRAETLSQAAGREKAERILQMLGVQVEPITAEHARAAADAFRRFGRRTPAGLNLGDCFAYALAAEQGDGLLFKGDDFLKTDVTPAA